MARQPNLKERVAILEERLKLFEAPPEHKVALADSTARWRCARAQTERIQRFSLIFAALSAGLWAVVVVVLALR